MEDGRAGEHRVQELNVIADYGDLCGEGPIWDSESGSLYWTDAVGLRFYRYDKSTGRHAVVKEGLEIFAFALNQPTGFVITNNSGIWTWDGASDTKLIVSEVGSTKCQMNDAVADPVGRLFAGSFFYDPKNEYELGRLIRLDTDGAARIVDEGIHLANGLGFSPDCSILYFTDSAARVIYAYDYNVKSGEVRNRRVVVKVPEHEGLPDGLTVDAEGFIWSAQWYGSCVVRYDPEGKLERRIPTPAKQTSAVTFGGEDFTDIFITTAAKSEPMPIMPPGYDPRSGYFGGRLYQINLGIQGKPEFKTQICPRQ
jgi:D-xylono/L-arabinono-1,4-lactonase